MWKYLKDRVTKLRSMNYIKNIEEIGFRFATSDDKDSIYQFSWEAIAGASLPEFAEDAGHDLQARIEQGDPENVLLAEDTKNNNKVIGYIELAPHGSMRRNAIYIRGIYVLPEYRRRGIGSEMLKIVRKNKLEGDIELRVHAFTQAGLKFWENYGFKVHHYSLYHCEE